MRQVTRVVCVVGLVLAGVPESVGAAEPRTADAVHGGLFAIASAIRPGSLNAMATIAEDDIWAVGSFRRGGALHWDGEAWTVHRTPGVPEGGELLGISALGADDIWAVGYGIVDSRSITVVQHWDGDEWRRVPSPNPSSFNTLYGVAAISPTDAWAVGTRLDDVGYSKTLIQHWNGRRWRTVPSPDPVPTNNYLFAVTAVSANDVWAVGDAAPDPPAPQQPLVQHWDGTAWTVVPAPLVGDVANVLWGVTAVGPDDVWAVGHFSDGGPATRPLIEHWDGAAWSPVEAPSVESATQLRAVAAASSPDDVWAVGFSTDEIGTRHAVTEHWDGHTWRVVGSDQVGRGDNFLVAVDVLGDLPWAAGFFQARDAQLRSLVERCCRR